MNNKICPLLSMSTPTVKGPAECLGAACAWYMPHTKYVPHANHIRVEGRCAIQLLGAAMPELIKAVNEI